MNDEEIVKQSDQLTRVKDRATKGGIYDAPFQIKNCYLALTGILAAIQTQTEAINRLTAAIYAVRQ